MITDLSKDKSKFWYLKSKECNFNLELGTNYLEPSYECFAYNAELKVIGKDKFVGDNNFFPITVTNDMAKKWYSETSDYFNLPELIVSAVNNYKCKILLNHNLEAMTNLPWNKIKSMFKEIEDKNQIVWLTGDSNMSMKLNIQCSFFSIFERLTYMLIVGDNKSRKTWYRFFDKQVEHMHTKKQHYFTLHMRRPKPWRIALMALIHDLNLFKNNIVSWGGGPEKPEDLDFTENLKLKNISLTDCKQYYNNISNKRLKIIKKMGDVKTFGKLDFNISNSNEFVQCVNTPSPVIDEEDVFNSYFQIISEAKVDNTVNFVTEKTYKAIASLQPFIIWGTPFSILWLEDQGYKIKNDFIDHSYDSESNTEKRFNMLKEEIIRLTSLSHDDWVSLIFKIKPDLIHNFFHFRNCFLRDYHVR